VADHGATRQTDPSGFSDDHDHLHESKDYLLKAKAANPRPWFIHMNLAVTLALKGEPEEAKAALAEAVKLNLEIGSLARWRAYGPRGQGARNPKAEALMIRGEESSARYRISRGMNLIR
jgi:hypothetical protein